jgi:hypothetical protein
MNLLNEQRDNIPMIGKLGKLSENDFFRILNKIENNEIDKNKCWIWNGTRQYKDGKGHQHGCIWYNKKYVQVHRIMYHNFIEDVPEYSPNGLIVLHKCSHVNDGKCINPWHMKLGTSKENTKDALDSNTLVLLKSNEENPMSKLTNIQINEIKLLKGSGITQKEIAKIYCINQSQVSRYWNNITRL